MLNSSNSNNITLNYSSYDLNELLNDNKAGNLPLDVKLSAFIASNDISFIDSFDIKLKNELTKYNKLNSSVLCLLKKIELFNLEEVLKLTFSFNFTDTLTKRSLVILVLNTQFYPSSFLSAYLDYPLELIIKEIKSPVICPKFKEDIYNLANRNGKLDLIFRNKMIYFDSYELKYFNFTDRSLKEYLANVSEAKTDVDRICFDVIRKRLM